MVPIRSIITSVLFTFCIDVAMAESGYDLWLRYQPIEEQELLNTYRSHLSGYVVAGNGPTIDVIQEELKMAFDGLVGGVAQKEELNGGGLIIARAGDPLIGQSVDQTSLEGIGGEGFVIQTTGSGEILITAHTDIGLLYGTFRFIRLIQTRQPISDLKILSNPEVDLRVLNHWDNLDRTSERGYAGFSIWDWHRLPEYIDPRYIDYARANASIGINGTVLTNVNANALVLTPQYLKKVKALADVFRPFGIRVYLTARFSAPIEVGGLETADPLNPEVRTWWNDKTKEIYELIPDFGGFLVKANSEGQPGPQNYGRSHGDGANMMAEALEPYDGVVMWRAFVYSEEEPEDRAKQAYNEFKPLDGAFNDNVLVQVKNGPIDFQPREPFHPLFGAMPETPLMMEFQVTQEYLGQATQLVYLAPMWKECLDTDTYVKGQGSQVNKVINGSLHDYTITGIAGVANIGTDINWTGQPFGQANWYAYGRLAWNTSLSSHAIAEEWIRSTFTNSTANIQKIQEMMMLSWEASVNYMTPLGLHHLMATGHHYGPGPWVDNLSRADWNPVYYHKTDESGVGFDRTKTGSNAIAQYHPEVAERFGSLDNCPEKFLLWFHHVDWDEELSSGRTLWEELAFKFQSGIDQVRDMQQSWNDLSGELDEERFRKVSMLLEIQEKEAIWWKDAVMLYFQTFSGKAFPEFLEPAKNDLDYYQSLRFPFAPGISPRW